VYAHIHPSSARFTLQLAPSSVAAVKRALCPMAVSSCKQSLYREPLRPRAGVTCTRHGIRTRIAGRYPGFVAPMGSCAGPKSSLGLGFPLVPRIFAGCGALLLEVGPSRRYLRESFLGCLDPYPGAPHGASTRFFPWDIGLPHFLTGSACRKLSAQRRRCGDCSRGCSHSLMFRPPGLLATQVVPTARHGSPHQGQP
jgi:hypothetical protein